MVSRININHAYIVPEVIKVLKFKNKPINVLRINNSLWYLASDIHAILCDEFLGHSEHKTSIELMLSMLPSSEKRVINEVGDRVILESGLYMILIDFQITESLPDGRKVPESFISSWRMMIKDLRHWVATEAVKVHRLEPLELIKQELIPTSNPERTKSIRIAYDIACNLQDVDTLYVLQELVLLGLGVDPSYLKTTTSYTTYQQKEV